MKIFGGTLGKTPGAGEIGGGAQSGVEHDLTIRFATVINSSLSQRTGAVQLSIVGIAGLDYDTGTSDPADTSSAESNNAAEQFSAPGIIGRPLPARTIGGVEQHMDVIAIATSDGLVPIAYRDLRLKMGGNGPGEGVMAFVGYGGGFHSLTPVAKAGDPAGGGTIQTFYCPFAYDSNGVAQKAHTVILDPTDGNESVMVVHSDGMALTMFQGAIVMKNATGDATLRLDEDGMTVTAKQIVLSGSVVLGNPNTAVPLLAGAASPPSTVVAVSPGP